MITLVRLRADHFKGLRDIDLRFPDQGSVLIEGQNEAGKSTLFEAIYAALYGKALVGEDESRPRLDDLITFDESSGWVELTFATLTARLRVRRDFTRGKGQSASVTIMRGGAADETRHGTAAVNERVLRELGNLDGDTLRNSCFVEQQELGRLESLSRGDREKAIERLLGLERLAKLAEHYRQEDKDTQKQLARATQLAELAQAQATADAMEATIAATRATIAATQTQRLLDDLAALRAQTTDIIRQSEAATARLRAAEEQITRADAITAWLQTQDDLARNLAQAQALRAAIAMTATERQSRQATIRAVEIPTAERQRERLAAAQVALRARDAARQAWDTAQTTATVAQQQATTAQAAHAALDAATATLTQAEAEVATTHDAAQHAEQQQRDAELRDALADWLRVAATVANVSDVGEREQHLQAQHATAQTTASAAQAQANTLTLVMVGALFLAAAGIGVALTTHVYLALIAVFALVAIIPTLSAHQTKRRATLAMRQAEIAWRQAQAQNEGARLAGADPALLAAQRAVLAQFGVSDDLTVAEGQRRYADLAARLPIATPTARANAQQALVAATAAQERATAAQRQRDDLATQLPATEPAFDAAATQRAEEAWHVADTTARDALNEAGLAPDADMFMVVAALTTIAQHIAQLEQEATAATEDPQTRQADLEAHIAAIMVQWRDVAANAQRLSFALPATSAAETMTPEDRIATALAQLAAQARTEYARLASADAPHQRDILNGQIGEQRQQREHLAEQQATQRALLVDLLAQQRIAAPAQDDFDAATLTQHWPLLGTVANADVAALEAEIVAAANRRFAATAHAQRLATELALAPATLAALDVAGSLAEVNRLKRQLAIAQRAAEVINLARLRIVRQVLPTTERNMRVILPLLTAGRYHDVRLTAPEAPDGGIGEVDYRIRVWDTTARRYVGKAIFSGGARDQCSLALRLSFALATLPQELGIAPGFLFLDEPLSAFDGERAGALVHLLTQGHIARAFAQVLVISHQHAFARADFRYHVRMEHGRVIASDLPTAADAFAHTHTARATLAP